MFFSTVVSVGLGTLINLKVLYDKPYIPNSQGLSCLGEKYDFLANLNYLNQVPNDIWWRILWANKVM